MEGIWIKDFLIVLACAGILVPFFSRLGINSIFSFLLTGMLIGPGGLGYLVDMIPALDFVVINDPKRVAPFAELGVIFLLFLIGLEVSLDRLWRLRKVVFGVAPVQVTLSAIAIFSVAVSMQLPFGPALVIAQCFALSSTAIVMQLLIDQRRIGGAIGQTSLAVLLFQDLAVVPILLIVGLLASQDGQGVSYAFPRALGLALLVVVSILVIGRFIVRPLLQLAAASRRREVMLAIALLLAVGTAVMTHSFGLSEALGAFLAGLLLAESEYRHQIESDIDPFKGLLLGLFFMTVGMSVQPLFLIQNAGWLALAVFALIAIKAGALYLAARLFNLSRAVSVEAAVLMSGAGEFAFVVIALAADLELLRPATEQFMIAVAAISMILTPLLAALACRWGRSVERAEQVSSYSLVDTQDDVSGHVIICGYGRIGRTIADILEQEGVPYRALDVNAGRVREAREQGKPVFYGDASRMDILKKVGAEHARSFVVTPEGAAMVERMSRYILDHYPHAKIIARAADLDHAKYLQSLGLCTVVPETFEASLQMACGVLTSLDVPEQAANKRVSEYRHQELDGLALDDDGMPATPQAAE